MSHEPRLNAMYTHLRQDTLQCIAAVLHQKCCTRKNAKLSSVHLLLKLTGFMIHQLFAEKSLHFMLMNFQSLQSTPQISHKIFDKANTQFKAFNHSVIILGATNDSEKNS